MSGAGSQLGLFGAEEAFVLRRSGRARRLSLRVFPHGVVEVVAPLRTGEQSIRRFIHAHADWIARARRRYRELQGEPSLAPPVLIELPAVGERWVVVHRQGDRRLRQQPEAGGGRLVLCAASGDEHWRRKRLRAWLLQRARETLLPWLEAVSEETGLSYAGASVRRQRSRWGSCTARRTISLNCALLFLEPELVRHLFVHELAHTRHLNHSRAFWRLVERLEPEFRSRERGLSAAWTCVPPWVSYDPPI